MQVQMETGGPSVMQWNRNSHLDCHHSSQSTQGQRSFLTFAAPKDYNKIQTAARDVKAAARKTITSFHSDEGEDEVCFNDIDKAVELHVAKSKEVFEFLYKLVENSETMVSEKRNVSGGT